MSTETDTGDSLKEIPSHVPSNLEETRQGTFKLTSSIENPWNVLSWNASQPLRHPLQASGLHTGLR